MGDRRGSGDEGDPLRRFLDAVWRHPWARFGFLCLESGLSEFKARRAREEALHLGYVETMRIATKGQPRPPRRYALTPAGAHHFGLPIPSVNRRAETLLAAPHLDKARRIFLGAAGIRQRMVWSISPWRAAPGLVLDALVSIRGKRDGEVLIAFGVPPEGAAASWWYLELLRNWFQFRRQERDLSVVLAVMGVPFAPKRMPMLIRSGGRARKRQRGASFPVYFYPYERCTGELGRADAWLRLPEMGWGQFCPWDEPTLLPTRESMQTFLGGRVPRAPRRQRVSQWTQRSQHHVASALRDALTMTHGEAALLLGLLRYPAFAAEELALLVGYRRRSVLRGLRRMEAVGLVERLPLFEGEHRFVLAPRGLDLLAYRVMQTPARFRARRAWASGHAPLTRSPRHMTYILAFMLALQRRGCLLRWDLLQARYGYCVAVAPRDLTHPRWVEVVPDSSGMLIWDGRSVPFWLEIDRGTRNGVRLTRQLEKYILARFGYAASDPIPMLLYVVAEGGEARARAVARRLVELAGRYRLRRTPAILITTWELLTDFDRSAAPDPLKPVWRLPFRWWEYIPPAPPVQRGK